MEIFEKIIWGGGDFGGGQELPENDFYGS